MKIVVIGGSIVNGFPVRSKDSFVSLWSAASDHEIINKGVNGSTAEDILNRFYDDVIAEKPDCAMLVFGTKDIVTKDGDVDYVFGKLMEMVDRCKKNNIRPVVAVPLLVDELIACESMNEDLGFEANTCIDFQEGNVKMRAYRQKILDAAAKDGFLVVDLQGEFEKATAGKDTSQFYADGLKLNAKGHKILFNIVKDSGLCSN